jgi:hypothetical protein
MRSYTKLQSVELYKDIADGGQANGNISDHFGSNIPPLALVLVF